MHYKSWGFSLVELLLIVICIGIAGTFALLGLKPVLEVAVTQLAQARAATTPATPAPTFRGGDWMEKATSRPTTEDIASFAREIQPLLDAKNTETNRSLLQTAAARIIAQYPLPEDNDAARIDIPISLPIELEPNTIQHHLNPWTSWEDGSYIGDNWFSTAADNNSDEGFIGYMVIDPLAPSLVIGRSRGYDTEPSGAEYTQWVLGFAGELTFLNPTLPSGTSQI